MDTQTQAFIDEVIKKSSSQVEEMLEELAKYGSLCSSLSEDSDKISCKRRIKMMLSKIFSFLEVAPLIAKSLDIQDAINAIQELDVTDLKDSEVSFHVPREILSNAKSVEDIKAVLENFAHQVFADRSLLETLEVVSNTYH
jgi:hypothetical protein